MAEIRNSKAFKTLKKSMIDSLRLRGLDDDIYLDKVNEYMEFWARKKELTNDIKARGLTVVDDRGRESENRSVSLEIQVSRQMLSIFTALGFKEEAVRNGMGCDDDEL